MSQKLFLLLFALSIAMLSVSAQAITVNADNSTNNDYAYPTSLINQMVEQNLADPNVILGPAFAQILNNNHTVDSGNETYQGIKQFWNYDLLGSLLANIRQIISNWLNQLFGFLPNIISGLSNAI